MHEMALVRNVMDIVLEEAGKAGATKVSTVYLTIGEGRDVIEDMLGGAFRFLARNTVAADADLAIRRVPFMVRCNRCGKTFHLDVHDEATWVCPACHAERDYKLFTGMEFVIESIEMTAAPAKAIDSAAAAKTAD